MDYAALSASERRFVPPAVAVSTIAFAITPPPDKELAVEAVDRGNPERLALWLPLVRRTRAPFLGLWALPGGATQWNEELSDTARRTLIDAVGAPPGYLEQLYSFGGIERSADAQRLVTIAYWALYSGQSLIETDVDVAGGTGLALRGDDENGPAAVPSARRWDDPEPEGTPDSLRLSSLPDEAANNVAWFSVDKLPKLAFDHAEIVTHALDRLRSKTEYAQVSHRFLGEAFTLAQLRRVHEAVQGRALDPANFRRQALAYGTLVPTGGVETGTRHRPAKLYRFVDTATQP